MALILDKQTPPIKPIISSFNGGGFVDDLLSLGGTLINTVGEAAKTIASAKVQAKIAEIAAKSAQPETARKVAPIKGVNEKGQTIVVTPHNQQINGFVIKPMYFAIGGGVLGLALLSYLAFK